jgi:hypothetical protein
MHITSLSLSLLVVGLILGCPTSEQPVAEPLTSVDGLEGGTLTGDLALADGELTAANVTVTDTVSATDVRSATVGTNSLQAITATMTDLTISGSLSLASSPVVAPGGGTLTPAFVGSAPRPLLPTTRAAAQGACAAAFAGSHICREDELLLAVRASSADVSVLDGLTVESPHRVIAIAQVGEPQQLAQVVSDNCGDWTLAPDVSGTFVETPAETLASGVTSLLVLHGRSEVAVADGFAFRNLPGCSPAEIQFACCQ